MSKQDEDKAREIANQSPVYFMHIYNGCLEMAAWKEQQMIEKAVNWINIHMLYNASESYKKEIIENLKKYMEEN